MSADLSQLSLRVSTAGVVSSLRSILEVFGPTGGSLEAVAQDFPDLLDAGGLSGVPELRADAFNLIFGKPVAGAADGTLEIIFEPSDRYVDFVTAIARDRGVACDLDLHGWPILSLSADTPRMIEAAGASSSGRGGVA